MSALVPCLECGRHARIDEPRCPFCGAARVAEDRVPTVRRYTRAGLTRAAVLAGATLLAPACGGPESGEDRTEGHGTGGGELTTEDEGGSEDQAGGVGIDAGADAGPSQEELLRQMNEQRGGGGECTPEGLCPPYGAPPADGLPV
jgi:hypothetical protein